MFLELANIKVLAGKQENEFAPFLISSLLASAKKTLDITMYEIWHSDAYIPQSLIDSGKVTDKRFDLTIMHGLNCAINNGVTVRFILDYESAQSNKDESQGNLYETLFSLAYNNENVSILRRDLPGIGKMHNKYIVVDSKAVWTGSYNWTTSAFVSQTPDKIGAVDRRLPQANTAVLMNGQKIALAYLQDFNAMWNGTKQNRLYKRLGDLRSISGGQETTYQIAFAAIEAVYQMIISYIAAAKTSINIAMFSYTDTRIHNALIEKLRSNIDVNFVIDSGQSTNQTTKELLADLKRAGANVRIYSDGLLHQKTLIVDSMYTGFGSYNFTTTASEYSDENYVVIGNKEVATAMEQQEFLPNILAQSREI